MTHLGSGDATEPIAYRRRQRSGRSRGQSMVELALALPLLLFLMLGTVDVGRVFFGYIQMRNGVFEGARYGSHVPSDTAGIRAAVMNHGVPSDVNVPLPQCDPSACNTLALGADATITVVATRTFTPISTSFLKKYFGVGVFHLSASATMKVMT